MKKILILAVLAALTLTIGFCRGTRGEMSPQDFLKIEDEVATTDLSPESKEKVAKKHGYTLQQYQTYEEKARTDKKLQEELGAIRLQSKQQ
ncbi:MAG TPA: hypothetical protein PKY31_02250 [Spirochaetota bacterium]|nr:hypothetical protein [Spirochaetota bacterium]